MFVFSKCLLTILTSPHLEIHEQTMLLAIKTCYNIQITSSSLVNQASARAALTQIINTVLSRFEVVNELFFFILFYFFKFNFK